MFRFICLLFLKAMNREEATHPRKWAEILSRLLSKTSRKLMVMHGPSLLKHSDPQGLNNAVQGWTTWASLTILCIGELLQRICCNYYMQESTKDIYPIYTAPHASPGDHKPRARAHLHMTIDKERCPSHFSLMYISTSLKNHWMPQRESDIQFDSQGQIRTCEPIDHLQVLLLFEVHG